CRDDPALFEIPPQPLGRVLLPGTPPRVHTRYRGLRTCENQRTPCLALRSRREPPFAAVQSRPTARVARARKERAAWEDTRIAQQYPPGTVSPGRRRAFAIPHGPLRGPAPRLPRTPHRGPLQVSAPPERAPSPLPHFQNALHTPPPRLRTLRPSRRSRPAAPTRSRVPTCPAPAPFVRNGRAPEPDGATSCPPRALRDRERFRGPFPPGHPLKKRGSNGRRESPGILTCAPQPAARHPRPVKSGREKDCVWQGSRTGKGWPDRAAWPLEMPESPFHTGRCRV